MHKAGVGILAGTDTTNPYCFPGFSLHDELALLVDAGLTPIEALQAATLNPAKFLNRLDDMGSVEPGKLADLVLLDADPLADIHNTTRIAAVVLEGKLLPKPQLQRMLDEVETANRSAGQDAAATKQAAWQPATMLHVRTIAAVQISPDGKQVAYVVRNAVTEGEKSEYRTQIHLAKADGSESRAFTQGEKSSDTPEWSPDGKSIAFVSDRAGKKNIWLIPGGGGEAEQLTDVKSGVSTLKWAPDGRSIAFTAADPSSDEEEKAAKEKNDARVVDEDIKMVRLSVVPVQKDAHGKRAVRQLTTANYSVGSGIGGGGYDWSPDSKTIAFTHTRTPKADDWPSADISLVEVASATVKRLVHTGAGEANPYYSPDGRWIAYTSSDDPPTWAFNTRIRFIPAGGGESHALAETFDHQPQLIGWSAASDRIYFAENRGTMSRLYAMPLEGSPQELGPTDQVIGAPSLNGDRSMLGFSMQSAAAAPEAYVSRVDRLEPTAVSRVNKELPPVPARTEVVRWKSAADFEIEGLLTYPVAYENGKRYPLLLVIHGGPTGVFSQNFIGSPSPYPVAAFAAKGYAVLRCNPRGSSGYGQKFRYANYNDWGGKDYQDIMAGVDHVIDMGMADRDRLGVMGWSYGGYMTSWVITHTHRFRAASVGAGVTNLMSFTGTADIPGFIPDYFGGEPWDKLSAYEAHSAMFHVKGVNTPTLIEHGEKDQRVPISQGYELYNALKRQGCPVKMVVFPRTPHGIQEPKLLLDAAKRNVDWFDKYLLRSGH